MTLIGIVEVLMPEVSRNRVAAIEVDHTRVASTGVDRTKVAIAPEVDRTRATVAGTEVENTAEVVAGIGA